MQEIKNNPANMRMRAMKRNDTVTPETNLNPLQRKKDKFVNIHPERACNLVKMKEVTDGDSRIGRSGTKKRLYTHTFDGPSTTHMDGAGGPEESK